MDLPNYFWCCLLLYFPDIFKYYKIVLIYHSSPVEVKTLAHTASRSEMELFTQPYSKEFPRAMNYFLDPAARGSSVEYL